VTDTSDKAGGVLAGLAKPIAGDKPVDEALPLGDAETDIPDPGPALEDLLGVSKRAGKPAQRCPAKRMRHGCARPGLLARVWVIIATALIGTTLPAAAIAETGDSSDLVATFYEYAPDATQFSASHLTDAPQYGVIRLTFPSQVQSPSPNNNLVRGYYYQPKVDGRVPAVVVLHGWGPFLGAKMEQKLCRALAERGMAAFFLMLPYHMERHAEGRRSAQGTISADPQRLVESGRQAVVDLRCVLDWLEGRPEVDSQRLGVLGISLGAIAANLAMGVDERLAAGVAIVGGGDLADVMWRSPLAFPWKWKMQRAGITRPMLQEILRPVEPITFADRNRPRRVLMINGYHDVIIPESSTQKLWDALGEPPIIWLNSGHVSLFLVREEVFEAAFAFLRGEFGVGPAWTPRAIRVRPVKAALLWDQRQGLRPGLFKELVCSGGRGRLSLDLGLTTAGFFLGASGAVTDRVAVGVGLPIGSGCYDPELYVALQLVL
jgi:dienelactone hydrolase